MSTQENELKKALDLAKQDEILNQEELDAVRGGSLINVSKGRCGDNSGNCVAGCACSDSSSGRIVNDGDDSTNP